MLLDIRSGLQAVLKTKKRQYPQHVNRISALGDKCLRKLYYLRHDWDKQAETDDGLQGIFETGNLLEPVIERIISEVGAASDTKWRIIGNQMPTNDKLLQEYQISGTIDGLLQLFIDDKWQTVAVADIKTMSPFVYASLSDYASLAKYSWTEKYRGQLMLYGLAYNVEKCVIICVNKTNLYDIKVIEFNIDMAYCEALLQKAAKVNNAIATNTPPDKINDPDYCPDCAFFSLCCPELTTGGNLQISDNDELAGILERLEELKPVQTEIDELEKQRDAILTKGQDVAIGRFLVLWKKSEVNYKQKEAYTNVIWRKKIVANVIK